MKCQRSFDPASRHAFTLLELLAVLGILTIFSLMLLPTLAGTRTNSRSVQCLNNLRRLTGAWLLYASDHADQLAPNPTLPSGPSWAAGIMSASFTSDNTNAAKLLDPSQTLIARYLQSADSFKCPADLSITVQGTPRARSVALMSPLGGNSGSPKPTRLPDEPTSTPAASPS